MDIHEIRKTNLVTLIGKKRKGACAEKWEMSPAHLSQILSSKTNKNLGDDVARRIESREGLPHGWLDQYVFVDEAHRSDSKHSSPLTPSVTSNRIAFMAVPIREQEAEFDGPVEEWSDDTPIPDDVVALPFLKEIELSAGSGRTAVEVATNRRLRFGKYSLRSQNVQADQAVAVTVCGNSMEPVMPNGTTVAVNRADTRIVDGKTYAIDHGGQLRVKLLYRLPGGGIRIRSHNRDEHPDEDYTEEQVIAQGLSIIGRVFWVGMYL